MDLWIRSQDKKQLIKAEYINTSSNGYRILVNGFDYGFYETKERALEVLDEIQDIISGNNIAIVYGTISEDEFISVYVMPEE